MPSFSVSTVSLHDIESMIRDCDFPAMIDHPFRLLMFPPPSSSSSSSSHGPMCEQDQKNKEGEEEDEISWKIDRLRESFSDPTMFFRKVQTPDGAIVGFAGWTEDDTLERCNEQRRRRNEDGEHAAAISTPRNLDIDAWVSISQDFQTEKRCVLHQMGPVCRLNVIAVNPQYQRKGVRKALMQWGCGEADRKGLLIYVMASPVEAPFYSRFEFEKMGEVDVRGAVFTSMLRPAQGEEGF